MGAEATECLSPSGAAMPLKTSKLVIDELREAIERLRQQPEAVQRHIAKLIQRALQDSQTGNAPGSYAGAWSDLQHDDEFAYFDRIRHETPPSPPMDEQLAWLDDDE